MFLAIILFGILIVADSSTGSSLPPALADENLVFLSDCEFGFHGPNYKSNEAVCVSGRVAFDDGEFLIPSGDVFVTPNLNWVDKAILEIPDPTDPTKPPLLTNDVTPGGANRVVGPGIGGAFFDEFVWLPMLVPGEYDIVLDDNRNGIYDAAIDYVIGGGSGFAFRVTAAPLGAFVIDVDKIKGGAAVEKANWEGVAKVYDNIGLMKDTLDLTKDLIIASGGSGTVAYEFVKGKVKGAVKSKIPGLNKLKKVDYNDAVMDIGNQMLGEVSKVLITHYDDLVKDPADPDFQQLISIDVATVDGIIEAALADLGFTNEYPYQPLGQRPLEAAYYDLANRLLEQAAIVRALIQSHEKYLGARNANDLEWAVLHSNGMVRYSKMLEENLMAANASALAVKAAMLALPGGLNEFEVEFLKAIKDQVQNGGFSKQEVLEFYSGGWTDADIANLTAAILAAPVPDANFTGPGTMDELVAVNSEYLLLVQTFGADALVLRDNLEYYVFEVDEPLADAGGPYAAGSGAAVALDGTASVSNDTSLTYEWDLDLDGVFDDLAGSSPVTSFVTPGDRLIGLKVTNNLGLSDIDYALASITLANLPPVITSFTPVELDVRVNIGDTPLFSVSATDPESDALSFEWFRNGVSVGSGTTYSYTAALGDEGIQVVRVRVSDTDPSSPDTFEQRELAVRTGDADSDLYHSNFDCNDADGSINPGAAEIVGDGIDNDCDAATPDSGQPPVAAFMAYPVTPVFGVATEFFNISSDANDDIVSFEWDFGDGSASTEEAPAHTYTSGGNITVSLTVTDSQANAVTATRTYAIKTPPVPVFSYDPDPAQAGEPTLFTDLSTAPDGSIIDWKWDFYNDGVTDSELQNPEFTFTTTGLFPVRLTVTDNDGVSVSSTSDVLVALRPVADFTVSPLSPVVAVTAQFTDASTDDGAVVEWRWDFNNDGIVDSNLQNPVHQFFGSGTQFVRLTVVDDVGATGTILRVVDVNVGDPPTPLFSISPTPAIVGEQTTFTDLSTDADNLIVGWEWDFENDGTVDSTLQNPTHVYTTFGTKDVLLRVTDQAGNQGELTIAGVPVRARPVASFDISDATPAVGQSVLFTDTSTDADSAIASYTWDFGDGSTGSGPTPSHTFATGGTFTVTLTVTDVHALVSTAIQQVAVTAVGGGPTADFDFLPLAPVAGETLTFTNTSTGGVVAYSWDFDNDGLEDSSLQNPTHVYPVPGTFTVTLTVTDALAVSDTTARLVTVGQGFPPNADFEFDPLQPIAGERTFFFNRSTDQDDSIAAFLWQFGDGGTSVLENPNHIYDTPGIYDVTLTVTDEAGNPDTLTISGIPVLARPVANFTLAPVGTLPIRATDDVQFTDASTDADNAIVAFEWDFENDGTPDSTAQNPVFAFPTNGTFDVVLKVTDATGLSDTHTVQVVVVSGLPPSPAFSFLPTTIVAGEPVQFTDESTDPDDVVIAWEWDFENDGIVDSFVENPVHTYPAFGTYDVRLLVRDQGGNQAALTITGIPVLARPVASFDVSNPTPGVASTVTFTSTSTDADSAISTFDWDFGDGTVDTGPAVTHAYAVGGTFVATLTVTDVHTLVSSATKKIVVVDIGAPTADFSFVPELPIVGTTVVFTDESTDDGSVVAWAWDFDDDGLTDDTTQNPTRLFSAFGTFPVSLTVTDNDANTDTVTRNVVVSLGSPPVAAFTNGQAFLSEPAIFTDLSTDADGDIVSWDWDFGDGATSSLQHPTRTFSSLGLKTVTLTVIDAAGNTDSTSRNVVVLDGVLPTAAFTFSPPEPKPGQFIQFTDKSTDNGAIVLWNWDFEDDGIVDSTQQNPTHSFPVGGTFSVRLTVEDIAGNPDTLVVPLTVSTAPLAAFSTSKARNVALQADGAEIAEFSSVKTSSPAINAIDNSTSSAWESREGRVAGEFIEIELIGLLLHSVDAVFVESGTGTDGIQNFELYLSPDGTVGSFTLAATGVGSKTTAGVTVNFTPTDARFARLVVLDNYGQGHVRVEQFKLFDTLGTDVASSVAGASVSNFSSVLTDTPEWRAIDGSTNNFWAPDLGAFAGEYLIVKLADKEVDLQVIDEVRIEGNNGTNAIRGFELQVSTTGTAPGDFTSILIGEAAKSSELTEITFPPVLARFAKLIVLSNWGHATEVRVDQFELWTRDREGGIVSLYEGPPGRVVEVSSVNGTSGGEFAIDQPFSSSWIASGNVDEFITVELAGGHIYTIDELRLYSSDSQSAPKNFDLLVSTTDADPASFSLAFSGVGSAVNTAQSFTFPPVQARFIKLFVHDTTNASRCCLRINNLAVESIEGGVPSKSRGLGAAVVELSNSSNTTTTHPNTSIDLSTSGGWTTSTGVIADQFFKLSLTPGTPGVPYLVNQIRIEGNTGTNSVKDFEIWISDTGYDKGTGLADPNFKLVLSGTLDQQNGMRWFEFTPTPATHLMFVARNNHGSPTNMFLDRFRAYAVDMGGRTVPFEDRSVDPGGTIVSWNWSFGDGATSTEQHPTHTYNETGTFPVTLTVTDNEGKSDTTSFDYTVLQGPVADFSQPTLTPLEGDAVGLFDTSTDEGGPIISRQWSFSYSGTTYTSSSVNAVFPDNGVYTVSLFVRDQQLLTDTVTKTFVVSNKPPQNVTSRMGNTDALVQAAVGEPVRNGGSWSDVGADNTGVVCDVDYGDGSTLQLADCSASGLSQQYHPFSAPGDYTVTLTITDKDGGWASDTQSISVRLRESQTTIWGADALRSPDGGGPVTAFARLVDFEKPDRGTPLAGETITFSLGTVTQAVVTDLNGEASATFTYAEGQDEPIIARFAGNAQFESSLDRPFVIGDVIAGVGDGMAHRFDGAGNFINVFDTTRGSRETTGMCFDSDDNLYVTSFQLGLISKFDRTTGVTTPVWASGFSTHVESCVLGKENLDADPELEDVIFTGEVDGASLIRKFDRNGNQLATYDVVVRDRGADWIDLTVDPVTGDFIMFYTTEGDDILRYDVTNNVQLPDFVPDQTVEANQLVPRPESLPENAIDDDVNTPWRSTDGDVADLYFTVELVGGTQTIDTVVIKGGNSTEAVMNFSVQVSTTGTDFTTVFTGVAPQNTGGLQASFAPVDAAFVRLLAIDNHGNSRFLRVEVFRILNTALENVASLTSGATIVDFNSVEKDAMLFRPCFAMRVLPDGSVMTACRAGVAHVNAAGTALLNFYPRESVEAEADTLFALNLDPDGTSFWTGGITKSPIVKVDIATGAVLRSFDPIRRGPNMLGLLVYGELLAAIDQAPIAHTQSVSTDEDTPLPITLTGTDFDGDPLTFEVLTVPTNGTLSGVAPALTYTPNTDYVGPDRFTFRVNDGTQNSAIAVVNIDVLLVNSPPVADTGGPYVALAGEVFNLDGSGSFDVDADDTIVSFEWDLDNDGAFDDSTLVSPTVSFVTLGLHTVSLRVTDNHGTFGVEQTSVLVIGSRPRVNAGIDQVIVPGGTVTLDPATFTDTGLTDTHSATIDWGDGLLETGSLTQGAGFGSVDGFHTYSRSGEFNVLVCVTDSDGMTGCGSLLVTVENLAPTADAGGPYTVDEGGNVTLDATGSFDPDGTVVGFEWDLDGDGIFGETGVDAVAGDETGATPVFSAFFTDGPAIVPVAVRVVDDGGATATASADITINNVAPTVEATGDTIDEGGSATVTVTFDDAFIFDSFTATIDWGEGDGFAPLGSVGPPGSPLTPSHVYDDDGVFTVTVEVTDDDGGIGQAVAVVTVNNVAPVGTLNNDGPVIEGSQASVSFSGVTDPSPDDMLAGFLYSFDFDNDGAFEITGSTSPTANVPLPLTADGPVSFLVVGRVSDKDGGTSEFLTEIVVLNVAPEVSAGGEAVDLGVASTLAILFSDPGLPDTHTVDVDWGDGSSASQSASQGLLALTHVYASAGTFDVSVTVTDDDGGVGETTTALVVLPAPLELPVSVPGGPYSVDEGSTVLLSSAGSTDADGIITLYEWDLDGDGLFGETGVDAVNGDETGASPTFSAASLDGPQAITVWLRVTDDADAEDSESATVNVNNVAPTATLGNDGPVDEGQTATVSLSGQADASADDTAAGFVYSYDFGNTGTFDITGSSDATVTVPPVFTADGPASVTVRARIEDKDGGFTDYTTVIEVNNVAPTVDAGPDQEVDEGTLISLASATFSDPGTTDTHTVTVNWGDGSAAEATHVYADNGTYTATVCVSDDDGATTCDTVLVTVQNVAPTVATGGDLVVDEGAVVWLAPASFNDLGTLDTHTATVEWGDGSAAEPGLVFETPFGPPGSTAGASGNVAASHVYVNNGLYTATICVSDDDGATTCDTILVTVNNVAPVVNAGPDAGMVFGSPFALAPATFTDAGIQDTHTAMIDWGDGSSEPGTVDESNGSGTVAGTHTYGSGGIFTVTVTVLDGDGGEGSSTTTVTVRLPQLEPPTADAGGPYSVNQGGSVLLNGSNSSDSDGTIVLYEWDLDGDGVFGETGADAASGDETGQTPTVSTVGITAPAQITVWLKVTDDDDLSDSGSATVTVKSTAPPPVVVDGLNPPNIPLADGSRMIAAGTGMVSQPGTISLSVPAGAQIRQVLLYWEGQFTSGGDNKISINGVSVTGTSIGGPTVFFGTTRSQTFRADITSLGLVSVGDNSIKITDMAFNRANNGAGIVVIIDDGTQAHLDLRDGNDLAFINFAPPLNATVPQVFNFEPASQERLATLSMFITSVSNTTLGAGAERPNSIEITTGGITTVLSNKLASTDGDEWDTLTVEVRIPAGADSVRVQLFSRDDKNTGKLPASLTWNMLGLTLPEPFDAPLALVGHWTFDDDTGTDSSGNGHNGTVQGAVQKPGRIGAGALRFDGVNDYVTVGNFGLPATAVTLTAWINSNDLANCSTSDCRIVSQATGTQEQRHYLMLSTIKSGDGVKLRFRLKVGGTTQTLIASTGNLANDEWFHVAATYDGAHMRLFLNGVEVGSAARTGAINAAPAAVPIWIGGNPDSPTSRPWGGLIDDVRLYDGALGIAEIQSLASVPPPPPPPVSLIGHWTFDDGGATDSSGNGHDGVVSGAALESARIGAGALLFDGVDDHVDVGRIELSGEGVTLAAWVKPSDLANCAVSDCRIVSQATGTQEQLHYIMLSTVQTPGGVKLRFRLKAGGTTKTLIASTGNLINGEWFHVAATYDGAQMRLFLDGVEVGSTALTGPINTAPATVPMWIGGNPDSPTSRPWEGLIDDVRLYDGALGIAEIQALASE